jgi:hypothetical protein
VSAPCESAIFSKVRCLLGAVLALPPSRSLVPLALPPQALRSDVADRAVGPFGEADFLRIATFRGRLCRWIQPCSRYQGRIKTRVAIIKLFNFSSLNILGSPRANKPLRAQFRVSFIIGKSGNLDRKTGILAQMQVGSERLRR